MKASDSHKTDISDSVDLMEMIGSVASAEDLSSKSDKKYNEEKQLVPNNQNPEEFSKSKNLQTEITQSRWNVLEEGCIYKKSTNPAMMLAPIKRKILEDITKF